MRAKDFLSDAVRITPGNSTIDTLRTHFSNEIMTTYQRVMDDSNKMKLSARQVYSVEEIANLVYRINLLRSTVLDKLPPKAQARRAANELLRFLK